MIYLYGLSDTAPAETTLAALAGVTGPVWAHETSLGWLIHGPAESADILPKRRFLLAHTRVLEAILDEVTLLPMRFGMVADTFEAVNDLLVGQGAEVAAAFDRVRDHVELGLRISLPKDPALAATLAETPALGAEHRRLHRLARPPHFQVAEFGRRLAETFEARRVRSQKALIARLSPHVTTHVVKTPDTDMHLLSLEVLVPRSAQDAFAAEAEAAAADHTLPGVTPEIRLIGPVPPFNFVSLSLNTKTSEAA